jgi:hypothetical protein
MELETGFFFAHFLAVPVMRGSRSLLHSDTGRTFVADNSFI